MVKQLEFLCKQWKEDINEVLPPTSTSDSRAKVVHTCVHSRAKPRNDSGVVHRLVALAGSEPTDNTSQDEEVSDHTPVDGADASADGPLPTLADSTITPLGGDDEDNTPWWGWGAADAASAERPPLVRKRRHALGRLPCARKWMDSGRVAWCLGRAASGGRAHNTPAGKWPAPPPGGASRPSLIWKRRRALGEAEG